MSHSNSAARAFIDSIPSHLLSNPPKSIGMYHSNGNFRFEIIARHAASGTLGLMVLTKQEYLYARAGTMLPKSVTGPVNLAGANPGAEVVRKKLKDALHAVPFIDDGA